MSQLQQRYTGKILVIGILLLPFLAYGTLFTTRYLQLHNNDWIINHAHMKHCGGAIGFSDTLLSCGTSECQIEDDKISLLTANRQRQTVEIIKREMRLDLVPILHVKHREGITQYCFK